MPDEMLPWFPVLMFHRVTNEIVRGPSAELCVRVEKLQQIIRSTQAEGFAFVTLAEVFDRIEAGQPVDRLAVLTFDDGFSDFYELGLPVLQYLRVPATLFIVTDPLGGRNAWDLPRGLPQHPLMTRSQVRELHQLGFEIGSHTASHPLLSTLPLSECVEELARSRRELEGLLGAKPRGFCYPYHDQNPVVQRAVAEVGYTYGAGGSQRAHTRFLLHRLDPPRFDPLSWKMYLRGWHLLPERAMAVARRQAA